MAHMRALGEVRNDILQSEGVYDEKKDFQTQSVSEMFKDKIISRAPDKMISFYEG